MENLKQKKEKFEKMKEENVKKGMFDNRSKRLV